MSRRFGAILLALLFAFAFCGVAFAAETGRYSNASAVIDARKASSGTVSVKVLKASTKKLKVRIQCGGSTYDYDLDQTGKWSVYPLQLGDGAYKISVYRNTTGKSYAMLYSATVDVKLDSEFAPFLCANQRVNYTDDTKVVKEAKELCADIDEDVEKVDVIYDYVIENYTYDFDKAKKAAAGKLTGYVPKLDDIYSSKEGICYDYASMMAAMLRSVGVPCKLITGYVAPDGLYHAWNEVFIEGEGWVTKQVHVAGEEWKLMDPTFASAQNNSVKINNFIGKGSNYTTKYTY